jgi:uroporphyrinogen decarboxylase
LVVQAEAMGSIAKYYPNQAPNVKQYAVSTSEAVLGLPLPKPGSSDRLDFVIESIRLMAQRHGATTPIIAPLLSPLDLPILLMGFEAWMDTVLFAPELAGRIVRYLTPCVSAYANALVRAGADILVMPMSFTSPAIVPAHVVRDVSVPLLREFLTGLQGPVVLHHGGVPMLPFMSYAKGLPMVVGLGMDERDHLHDAREQIGPEAVLLAGPLGPTLSTLSPQAVLEHCGRFLRDRQGDPRFIVYSSAADISLETPPENITAVVQSAIIAGAP